MSESGLAGAAATFDAPAATAASDMLAGISALGWPQMSRVLDTRDLASVARLVHDDKLTDGSRLYVPAGDEATLSALQEMLRQAREGGEEAGFVVEALQSADVSLETFVSQRPGLLALSSGARYAVPGGRFNEMYGWDSFFMALGLLESEKEEEVELGKSTISQLLFEIKHYGKVLNANRSYYLNRSQPPFTTSALIAAGLFNDKAARDAALAEYSKVWMGPSRLDVKTGLSHYGGDPVALCRAVQVGGYDAVFAEAAQSKGMPVRDLVEEIMAGKYLDPDKPDFDASIRHIAADDIAMRESGHDTSARLVGSASVLASVDLNSLLYKAEKDLGLDDEAGRRQDAMCRLMWDGERGVFFDYDTEKEGKSSFLAPSGVVYPLWAGLASPEQANKLRDTLVRELEKPGGIVGCSQENGGHLFQWDYPWGWAPHQMLAWEGLIRYGFVNEAQRICYKWLLLAASLHAQHGCVPEKLDVVTCTLGNGADVEYGTQCTGRGEYFGWTSASIVYGAKRVLTREQLEALQSLTPAGEVFSNGPTLP